MLTTSLHLLDRLRDLDDRAAWEQFLALYSPLLLRWACHSGVPLSEAADVVQDALVVVIHDLPAFRRESNRGSFRAWLYSIVRRTASSRPRRGALAADGLEKLETPVADDPFWEKEYRQLLVRRALDLMRSDFEPATWQACWEHVVSGRSAAEVGRQLGLSEGAVYVAKSRVLRRLREELLPLLD